MKILRRGSTLSMAFVDRIVAHDEKLVAVAPLHWIHLVIGLWWMLVCVFIAWILDYRLIGDFDTRNILCTESVFGSYVSICEHSLVWLVLATGVTVFFAYVIKFFATEIALTSKRLVYKTGLIVVKVEEIELEDIRGEHIRHGVLGQFLNYGRLHFDCRFIGDMGLPAVTRPYEFLDKFHMMWARVMDDMHHHAPPPMDWD